MKKLKEIFIFIRLSALIFILSLFCVKIEITFELLLSSDSEKNEAATCWDENSSIFRLRIETLLLNKKNENSIWKAFCYCEKSPNSWIEKNSLFLYNINWWTFHFTLIDWNCRWNLWSSYFLTLFLWIIHETPEHTKTNKN